MNLEQNPFQLLVPLNTGNIQSLTLVSNLDWFDATTNSPVTGQNAFLHVSAKSTVSPLKVFATGASTGTPSMRSLTASHIPDIAISQVTGLQSSLNSIVKSLTHSLSSAIEVVNNGVGGYTITPHFGTLSGTIAEGNDTRFPASVSGIRKGSGVGAADSAAIAKTDYWDTTVFVASGTNHAIGLVPDPGASSGTAKYLREDATWHTPSGTGTVTSIALTVPAFLSVAGSPVTTSGTFALSLANQTANTFFAGPSGGSAAPTFRSISYSDVQPIVGQAVHTIVQGNDSRFSSSVVGIRKSSGDGSSDVAAVAGTDFAPAAVFIGSGPSAAVGLVPSPGPVTGSGLRFLKEDSTWATFTPDTASLTNAMLSTMATKTLKANATGSTASPTDVDAKTARSSSLLNLESITTHGDSDYAILSTDRYVATSATLTANRTWSLPLANLFNAGQHLTVSDDFGGIGSFVLKISRSGSDVIQGSSAVINLTVARSSIELVSDGTSKWSVVNKTPTIVRTFYTANATYTTPTGCKALFVEAIGGGGGGGGAIGGSSTASIGGGGGSGGYSSKYYNSPSATYAMTIGSGGAGGVGAAAGVTGGTTQFASDIIAQGGGGGATLAAGTSATFVLPGFGGVATSGDINTTGNAGIHGTRLSGLSALSGAGASVPFYCANSTGLFVSSADGNSAGAGYGGGGGGAVSYSAISKTGGVGMPGVIIVTEYY